MSKEWNFKQELVAVFGKPIAENPTPVSYTHLTLPTIYSV